MGDHPGLEFRRKDIEQSEFSGEYILHHMHGLWVGIRARETVQNVWSVSSIATK